MDHASQGHPSIVFKGKENIVCPCSEIDYCHLYPCFEALFQGPGYFQSWLCSERLWVCVFTPVNEGASILLLLGGLALANCLWCPGILWKLPWVIVKYSWGVVGCLKPHQNGWKTSWLSSSELFLIKIWKRRVGKFPQGWAKGFWGLVFKPSVYTTGECPLTSGRCLLFQNTDCYRWVTEDTSVVFALKNVKV